MAEGVVQSAMLLAAGRGERMRPLTLTTPKPLVEVAGKPLIAYGLEKLRTHGTSRIVVNAHWLADQIGAFAAREKLLLSDERDKLLDTGGGVNRALHLLGDRPFFVLNSDCFWQEGASPALARLAARFSDEMDALLLLAPVTASLGYEGRGDFLMDAQGRLSRRPSGETSPFVFAGAYLVRPSLFAHAPEGAFSMNLLWDRAMAQGRLFGLRHDGRWFHVGTAEAIAEAARALWETG